MSGREVESISGVERDDSGRWRLRVETVELERIPDSTSVMATYQVEVDDHGQIAGFQRLRRYYRNQADES